MSGADQDRAEGANGPDEWLDRVHHAEQIGDYLGACDAAIIGLEQHRDDRELQYCAVLNLSRAGARTRAEALWKTYNLGAVSTGDARSGLALKIAALGGRLAREHGLAQHGPARSAALHAAAELYGSLYRSTGSSFPGINAAVLYLLSGDDATARQIAAAIVDQPSDVTATDDGAGFNLAADHAAANLILDRRDAAHRAVEEAGRCASAAAQIASTRKQLIQICAFKGLDEAILEGLQNRAVIHYTGHMISPPGTAARFPAEAAPRVAERIRELIDRRKVGFGHGSLACGADLMIVETLLTQAGRVEAVLPFEIGSFRANSVERGGPDWIERFERVLPQVQVTRATDDVYSGDPEVFAYTSRLAMGSAILKARALAADLFQLAVWDGRATQHAAGTAADIGIWRGCGLPTTVIESGGNLDETPQSMTDRDPGLPPRKLVAIMFGDFRGFSRLSDRQMLDFNTQLMGITARTLDRYGDRIMTRNTWGDGLFVVFDDVAAGAACALELQRMLSRLDLSALKLPPDLGLRLAMHAGAVFEIADPVLGGVGFTGSHISRTARLEPVTPAGEVYVTESFASLLMLDHSHAMSCDYVGSMPAAKGYGRLRMYLLKQAELPPC